MIYCNPSDNGSRQAMYPSSDMEVLVTVGLACLNAGGKGKIWNTLDSVDLLTSKSHSKAKLEVSYGI